MSNTPEQAAIVEQEMHTIIFYLTALGHIDGEFDQRERSYIREFIERLVAYRVRLATKDPAQQALRPELTARWTQHFHEVSDEVEQTVQSLFTESVAEGETSREFVFAKLKLRCFELFEKFSADNQAKLLLLADELIQADGTVHPNEAAFRDDLRALLAAAPASTHADPAADDGPALDLDAADVAPTHASTSAELVEIPAAQVLVPRLDDYDFFRASEYAYARDPAEFARQAERDLTLIQKTVATWRTQRQAGAGWLTGVRNVGELEPGAAFLDGYTYAVAPALGRDYELLVLGDLHGCYSCLKAALMQADFFAKVDAHHLDPVANPAMKLVLLGDYIDRGRYSYNGVLRTVMQIFLTVPEHVYVLRGNHEYYIEHNGKIYGGVRPAEAIESLEGIARQEVFAAYKSLFEAMPSTLLFGRTFFVHAGIPREDTVQAKWVDLASLNDPEMRFQMLWSDPSEAEYIPLELQQASARFPFGRQQFRSFMARLGCTTMVRGHEREVAGLRRVYGDPDATLLTLFSSGGRYNDDVPITSNYRDVRPLALTIRHRDGVNQLAPFVIDYERYNDPARNAFLKG